jgi:hypothetical protein
LRTNSHIALQMTSSRHCNRVFVTAHLLCEVGVLHGSGLDGCRPDAGRLGDGGCLADPGLGRHRDSLKGLLFGLDPLGSC